MTPEECFSTSKTTFSKTTPAAGSSSSSSSGQHYSASFKPFDPRTLGVQPIPLPASLQASSGSGSGGGGGGFGVEVVVVVGAPGSGKSSLSKRAFPFHEHVNQDQLKKKEKCWQACRLALARGQSVVIDNQNRSKADRAPYLEAAKEAGVPCRAVRD
jgi:bifunctional polynucleotide phosphatase/kinase